MPETASLDDSRAAQQSAEVRFVEFYRTDVKSLVRFLLYLGARLADAVEIAQDTMTDAHRNWATIHRPRSWVRVAASRAYGRRMASTHEQPTPRFPSTHRCCVR